MTTQDKLRRIVKSYRDAEKECEHAEICAGKTEVRLLHAYPETDEGVAAREAYHAAREVLSNAYDKLYAARKELDKEIYGE